MQRIQDMPPPARRPPRHSLNPGGPLARGPGRQAGFVEPGQHRLPPGEPEDGACRIRSDADDRWPPRIRQAMDGLSNPPIRPISSIGYGVCLFSSWNVR